MNFQGILCGSRKRAGMLQVEVHVLPFKYVLNLLVFHLIDLCQVVAGVARCLKLHALRLHQEVDEIP